MLEMAPHAASYGVLVCGVASGNSCNVYAIGIHNPQQVWCSWLQQPTLQHLARCTTLQHLATSWLQQPTLQPCLMLHLSGSARTAAGIAGTTNSVFTFAALYNDAAVQACKLLLSPQSGCNCHQRLGPRPASRRKLAQHCCSCCLHLSISIVQGSSKGLHKCC